MKTRLFILLAFFLAGCGGSIKSSLGNFRAHYNTHYNASKNFRAGLKKEEDQPVEIKPDAPVRAHESPRQAGKEDFENAIEKEAQLLRKFPDSKWTDDALFLIGRSYYYLNEFYPALQKFEELAGVAEDPALARKAVIWKGRTQLDLNLNGEAISYLKEALTSDKIDWDDPSKAEVHVLLGEHYAELENWESSAQNLAQALENLDGGAFRGRTFFLYGQVLERLGRFKAAFSAYDEVSSDFPDYEYIYWADMKKANVAREEGQFNLALSIYRSMEKDDKNFQRRQDIEYEVARTYEMMNDYTAAEDIYNQILHSPETTLSRDAHARIYFRLGKIYSDIYNNYRIAAAYFDSSSSQASNINEFNEEYDVRELSVAFDRYTTIRHEINRLDSLLYLSTLSPGELDSALTLIRRQKQKQVSRQIKEDQSVGNTMNNVSGDYSRDTEDLNNSSAYGFLNYKNPVLLANSRAQFEAFWGNRPLVDDWRRAEAIQEIATKDDSAGKADGRSESGAMPSVSEDSRLDIDLSEIPATNARRAEMEAQLNTKLYELGNMFFLTLNLPDSAAAYFRKVIDNKPPGELVPKSMYSLFEMNKLNENEEGARYWGQKIMREYPDTKYAVRVSSRLGTISNPGQQTEPDSTRELLNAYQAISTASDSLSGPWKAKRYRSLALANRSSELAPYIYYQAIMEYVRFARAHTDSAQYRNYWREEGMGTNSPDERANLTDIDRDKGEAPDSLRATVSFPDTAMTGHGEKPVSQNPFEGSYWDRVRTMLAEYDSVFTDAPHTAQVKKIEAMLHRETPEKRISTCKERGLTPQVKPDMNTFLQEVKLPDPLKGTRLSGKITFRFILNSDGRIISYRQVSKKNPLGIDEAYRDAIDRSLHFYSLSEDGEPFNIQCDVTFPISN